MRGLKVEIVGVEALTQDDWALWSRIQSAEPDLISPYFWPQFTRVAAEVCPGAAVAVFRRGTQTIGYFPHQRRSGTMQPLAAPMNDYHGIIARAADRPSLDEAATLLNAPRLTVGGWVGHGEVGQARRTVQVQLPDGDYAAWYSERRKSHAKFFKDKERARRSMEAELGPIEVKRGLRDPELLDQLIALKRDQYRRTGRHDIFACGWTADLLHRLMAQPEGGLGASMAGLWAGGRLCAMEYSMHAGDQYHFWFPGYFPELARCSPGILLSMDTMQMAGAAGYRTFDFGFEGEHYKKYFCNAEREVREAVILRPGLGASVSQAAVGLLNVAGAGRGEQLRNSVRRRWAAIEACEVTPMARARGAVNAAQAALAKVSRPSHA